MKAKDGKLLSQDGLEVIRIIRALDEIEERSKNGVFPLSKATPDQIVQPLVYDDRCERKDKPDYYPKGNTRPIVSGVYVENGEFVAELYEYIDGVDVACVYLDDGYIPPEVKGTAIVGLVSNQGFCMWLYIKDGHTSSLHSRVFGPKDSRYER